MTELSRPDLPDVPLSWMFWRSMPLPMRWSFGVVVLVGVLSRVEDVLAHEATVVSKASPDAALVLLGIEKVAINLSFLLLGFGALLLVISLPLLSRRRQRERLVPHARFTASLLVDVATIASSMAGLIAERDEQLQVYDELEKLRDAGVEELVERFQGSSVAGIRATWISGLAFFLLAVLVSIALFLASRQ